MNYLKSKTLWAGAATIAVGAWQNFSPFIPPQYMPLALAAAGVLTVAFRTITSQPLSEK